MYFLSVIEFLSKSHTSIFNIICGLDKKFDLVLLKLLTLFRFLSIFYIDRSFTKLKNEIQSLE